MQVGFEAVNDVDENGNPAGGIVEGTGFAIKWQNGPLGRIGSDDRVAPNGAFVEDVIASAIQRIQHYQSAADGKFECVENTSALTHLNFALKALENRTSRRVLQNVEGTHEGS